MPPRLIILGSSAGLASAHRAASSYLLDCGDYGIMIDCGDGATRNFLSLGFRPEWVEHLFISHTHADHIFGVPYFIQQRHLSRTDVPITIHCAPEVIEFLTDVLQSGYLFLKRLSFDLVFEPVKPRTPWQNDLVRITPYPTTHVDTMRAYAKEHGWPDRGGCTAFHVSSGHRTLLYSADLGSLNDLRSVPGSINWLLIETSHVELDQLWTWVEERGIQQVILTHIADDFDLGCIENAAKYTSAKVLAATDGLTLDLI
jgi:ribonuclease BN (tRNA processing enzyme)